VGIFGGLGLALILAVYDYLGYYNVCYLAEEIKEPTKTIPRVIVVSILSVAVLYILMNACIVSVLPMQQAMSSKSTVADFVAVLAGRPVARLVTGLILWTAFASVFSLTLGYSRILFAAARDGNFFPVFARLHPTEGYPVVALLALGGAASVFSFLNLKVVVSAIVSIRAIIPFIAQIAAALVLRKTRPDLARPFRMWLYPLPAFVALLLWGFVLFSPEKGFKAAGLAVLGAGIVAYLVTARRKSEWPFTVPA
jgi:amino acid transporter